MNRLERLIIGLVENEINRLLESLGYKWERRE